MLTNEETFALLKQAKNGDDFAKGKLINLNSPLIKSIVKRYLNKGIEYDDLYQLGAMGFVKAINNYDPTFNVKFTTYAVPMIAGEIKRFLRDDGTIKVSRVIKAQAYAINKFIDSYTNQTGESPSLELISKTLNINKEDVIIALDSTKAPLSLSEPIDDKNGDKSSELADRIPSDEKEEDLVDKILLKSMIENLPPREKKIIIMRYYRDSTQSEVAKELGVSQVQVSRIENKIISSFKSQI